MSWIDPSVAGEFPDLRLHEIEIEASHVRSPAEVRERMRMLSDGFRGSTAVVMRSKPIPHAYRVFFRHIGLDPDVDRTPIEALAVERLKRGRFVPRGLLEDAITIAMMETSVALYALDATAADGPLGIRPAKAGEEVAGIGLPPGRLVIADGSAPVGVLFGDAVAPVTRATTRARIFAVQVTGVPVIHIEEALWTVQDIVEGEGEAEGEYEPR